MEEKTLKITDIFLLVSGLALFLYGMNVMEQGLELAAGERLKTILEKLTSNRLLAVLVGLLVTAVIQSSSATTVMAVGFVNSGLMTLSQAVGIIMGANIGTTVTGQLIALNVTEIAPLFTAVGLFMMMMPKKKKVTYYGNVIAGLGILFMGLNIMSTAMVPLRELPWFQHLMVSFSNPVLGILAGALITAVIQSSSASIGILQALASQGLIGIGGAVYIIFGQNIGTCVTSLLASMRGNRSAKRTALCHILFNIIGTVIFVVAIQFIPFTDWVVQISGANTVKQIANVHTIFNIVTTILLFPFGNQLARLATRLIPQSAEPEGENQLMYLKTAHGFLDSSRILTNIESEIGRMGKLAEENLTTALELLRNYSEEKYEQLEKNEETIDYLNKEITRYIVGLSVQELSAKDSSKVNHETTVISNLERIGDHAQNIADHARHCFQERLSFTPACMEEITNLQELLHKMSAFMDEDQEDKADNPLPQINEIEDQVDDFTEEYRLDHLARMKVGECSCDAGIIYDEILTDLERVADHLLNIAECRYKAELSSIPA